MWRGLILLIIPSTVLGFGDLEYGTDIHHSEWEYAGTTTECLLMHKIEGYGSAWFIHRAGRELMLEIKADQRYRKEGKAIIRENPPAWVHDSPAIRQEDVPIKKGNKPFDISPLQSQWMLETLARGWGGQVEHPNRDRKNSYVRISINPVNFLKSLPSYQECIKALLPYTYEEVRRYDFRLGTKQSGLSGEVRGMLDKMATFLSASPKQYRISIESHTDNIGRRSGNKKLSQKRAQSVADYLISRGVAATSISSKGYGESRPKASNRTKKGRALNRRVEVRLVEVQK
ncbi:MAG: OmpA family protein [Sedimenticola sp.]